MSGHDGSFCAMAQWLERGANTFIVTPTIFPDEKRKKALDLREKGVFCPIAKTAAQYFPIGFLFTLSIVPVTSRYFALFQVVLCPSV